jgi:hypothetical protein
MASVIAIQPKVRGVMDFKGDKNPQHTLLRTESKPIGPMS